VDFETCEAMALGAAVHQQIESIREANRLHGRHALAMRRGDEPAVFIPSGDFFHGTTSNMEPEAKPFDLTAALDIMRAFTEMYRAQPSQLPPDFMHFDLAGHFMIGDYKPYSIAPGDENIQLRVYRECAKKE
jgi:hypothetical protein